MKTNWSTLTHAYGPADDVPAAIAALGSDDDDERVGALDWFHGCVLHQGSQYTATIASVRPLIALLDEAPDPAAILELLATIAVVWPEEKLFDAGLVKDIVARAPFKTDSDGIPRIEQDQQWVSRRCYVEVARGAPLYARFLEKGGDVGIAAAMLLAFLPTHGAIATPHLRRVASDRDEDVSYRVAAVIAVTALAADDSFFATMARDEDETVRAIATVCAAIVRANDAELPDSLERALADVLAKGPPDVGFDTLLSRCVIRLFLRAHRRPSVIARLAGRLRSIPVPDAAETVARSLLAATFGEPTGSIHAEVSDRVIDTSEWTAPMRDVAKAIVETDCLWPHVSGIAQINMRLDFSPERDELRAALIGPPRPPPAKTTEDREHLPLEDLAALVGVVLESPDSAARAAAAWKIHCSGDRAASFVARLVAGLGEEPGGAFDIPAALRGIPSAWPRILAALRSMSNDIATPAARAFPSLDTVGLDRVLEALEDEHPRVRSSAAYCLQQGLPGSASQADVERAVAALLARLHDPDADVSQRAEWALMGGVSASGPVVAALRDPSHLERRASLLRIARAQRAKVETVAAELFAEADEETCLALVDALAAATPVEGAALALALGHAQPEVRTRAIRVLGVSAVDSDAIAAITRALDDDHTTVRMAAAIALGRLRARSAVSALNARLRDDESVATEACWALAAMGERIEVGDPILQAEAVFAGECAARLSPS